MGRCRPPSHTELSPDKDPSSAISSATNFIPHTLEESRILNLPGEAGCHVEALRELPGDNGVLRRDDEPGVVNDNVDVRGDLLIAEHIAQVADDGMEAQKGADNGSWWDIGRDGHRAGEFSPGPHCCLPIFCMTLVSVPCASSPRTL